VMYTIPLQGLGVGNRILKSDAVVLRHSSGGRCSRRFEPGAHYQPARPRLSR
jgi:hypothetical protein